MEVKSGKRKRLFWCIALCVCVALLCVLWFLHDRGYCATAAEAADILQCNEQLFRNCQAALSEQDKISYITYHEASAENVHPANLYCIDGAYLIAEQPVEEQERMDMAMLVNRLNDAVPLRSITIRQKPLRVEFCLKTTNILNAVLIVYSSDGSVQDQYINDSYQIDENWFAYITGD